jgi:hypothetical protein
VSELALDQRQRNPFIQQALGEALARAALGEAVPSQLGPQAKLGAQRFDPTPA